MSATRTQLTIEKSEARGRRGMAATKHAAASAVGVEVLAAGGSAADAAVAAAFAVGVVEPWMSGIGGGGFAVVLTPDHAEAVAFPMRSGSGATPDRYPRDGRTNVSAFLWDGVEDDANLHGYRAMSVPGAVAGLGLLHERHGRLPWRDLVRPAVQLAREGFELSWYDTALMALFAAAAQRHPELQRRFYPNGQPPQSNHFEAQRIRQPELAATLEAVAEGGPEAFYQGDIAAAIAAACAANDGVIARADLAAYRARVTPPLSSAYRGVEVLTPGPGGAGPTTLETLNIYERAAAPDMDHADPERLHAYLWSSRLAVADRVRFMADPERANAPWDALVSKAYAATRAAQIDATAPPEDLAAGDAWAYQAPDRALDCLIIFTQFVGSVLLLDTQNAFAQLQSEFGQSLLERKPEIPETDSAELTIDSHFSNTFNNHIEFGLSVDPYTSGLAGEEDSQLEGMINRFGVNLLGDLPITDKLRLKLQYAPQVENYTGADGKLNEFDAFSDVFSTEVSFQPVANLPPLVTSHQLQRFVRSSNVYNNTDRQFGLRFGRVLEYNLRLHRFDDEDSRREDFLLVGSTNHRMTARLQFGILKQILGKLEYGIERSSYQTNLNNLILGITGLDDNERRNDWRHIGSTKLIQVAMDRLVFQEEVNLFLNRSNVDFFNFVSTEVAASSFYRFETGRWLRLRFSRLWVLFEGRQIPDEIGNILEDAPNRRDTQIGANVQLNWELNPYLTLNADYQVTQNRTNEVDPLLDFLNYTQTIATVTLRGQY